MDENYSPVLAMYDIRGKQEFIFRSQHIKEIIGGSAIIRDCYVDYLKPCAEKYGKGIFGMNDNEKDIPFTEANFMGHIESGYIGEIVYEGGGNFILLYKNVDYYKQITYDFTKMVLIEVGTLKILGSYIDNVNFEDYRGDNVRLYEKHRRDEAVSANAVPWGTLSIVQADLRTSAPLVYKDRYGGKITKESKAKYDKYLKETRNFSDEVNEQVLDNIVTKKGEDSNLAIVYIDGNSMGAKVQDCYKDIVDGHNYENCVRELRSFSKKIQKDYIDDRKKDIDSALAKLHPNDNRAKRRLILGAGDEINFICNASDAYALTKTYLRTLPEKSSSCAGIAIFKSHAPYADAYRIAEECCESGKTVMKEEEIEEISFVDFHYCQGAIGISLEGIRQIEGTMNFSRPWMVRMEDKDSEKLKNITSVEDVEKLAGILNTFGRSNIKGLLCHAKKNSVDLRMELNRIVAHMPADKKSMDIFDMWREYDAVHGANAFPKLLYDTVLIYDLWFNDVQGDR